MFEAWLRELEASPGLRAVEGGHIKLDSVPSPAHPVPGVRTEHAMDGALVIVWYKAQYSEATARAIQEAATATAMMHLPRQLYTGRLIDLLRARDGSVYFKLRAIERLDEATHAPAYRSFNPSKGQLIEMTVNPTAANQAEAMAHPEPAHRIVPVALIAAQRQGDNGHGLPHQAA
jgi:hypothetical protein